MNTEISLYHLSTTPLEKALPKLLEKIFMSGKHALVIAGSEERVESLNDILWTYSQSAFLPHGSKKDGMAESQPIWLTTELENPNHAAILVLTDNVWVPSLENFERCIDIFDGEDKDSRELAKKRIHHYKHHGHMVTYWQQDSTGIWNKKVGFEQKI